MTAFARCACGQVVARRDDKDLDVCPRHALPPKLQRAYDKADKQRTGNADLPPLIQPADPNAFAFRLAGSPMSQNRAWAPVRFRGRLTLRKNDDVTAWRSAVRLAALKMRPAGWRLDGQYRMRYVFWFERETADASNPIKLIEDALQDQRKKYGPRMVLVSEGACFHNDNQIQGHDGLDKYVDPNAPRLEVYVRRLS